MKSINSYFFFQKKTNMHHLSDIWCKFSMINRCATFCDHMAFNRLPLINDFPFPWPRRFKWLPKSKCFLGSYCISEFRKNVTDHNAVITDEYGNKLKILNDCPVNVKDIFITWIYVCNISFFSGPLQLITSQLPCNQICCWKSDAVTIFIHTWRGGYLTQAWH